MKQKVFKTGNSLAVTVPNDFVKNVGVKAGDEVKVTAFKESGKLQIIFKGAHQLLLVKK
ncbi:MAG: AbrB/MazE/SpoVT family DNA-binding domain-containing protein [Patescibacteria group bacterium]